jgi:hypothetical protein
MKIPQALSLHNGEKVPRAFSRKEMSSGLAPLQRYTAASDLKTVLFAFYHNTIKFPFEKINITPSKVSLRRSSCSSVDAMFCAEFPPVSQGAGSSAG